MRRVQTPRRPKRRSSKRGPLIGVAFFNDEDAAIRAAADADNRRPVADMVRVLALEGLKTRTGAAS